MQNAVVKKRIVIFIVLLFCFAGYAFGDDDNTFLLEGKYRIAINGGYGVYHSNNFAGNIKTLIFGLMSDSLITTEHDNNTNGTSFNFMVARSLRKNTFAYFDAAFVGTDFELFAPRSEQTFLDDYRSRTPNIDNLLRISMFSSSVGLGYNIPVKRFNFYRSGGLALVYGKIKHIVPSDEPAVPPNLPLIHLQSTARGAGFILSSGTYFAPLRDDPNFLINLDFGYRYLKTGRLTNDEYFVYPDIKLEFSGPYVSLGLGYML